jgi:LacI family transcriptional regulator
MHQFVPKPTLNDIARELSITPSTVSRALNNHNSISSRTKQAVRNTARRLDYQPNKIASSLRIGKSKIIGVIIPSAEINFFGSIVHGIEKIASHKGYNVLMYQSHEEMELEKKGIITFLRSGVDCVLASISKETTDLKHFTQIKRRGVPLIFFDRANDELNTSSVVIDDYAGAFSATEHLIQQGCKRIAHIAGQQHVSIFKQRLNGYIGALKKHGFTIDYSLIKYG